MKEFEIWCSGYAATGEHSPAHLMGKFPGESFDDAVHGMIDKDPELKKLYDKGERYLPRNSDGTMQKVIRHSIWGCTLYDNEADARKSFG
jgi:hypothetical protein